jgi:hypothetical protein
MKPWRFWIASQTGRLFSYQDLASVQYAACSVLSWDLKPEEGDQMSQVKFKFASQYNPLLVSLGGTVLCNFCPISQKTPVEVEVLVDPGTPSELVTNSCGGMASPVNTCVAHCGVITMVLRGMEAT